MAPWHTYHSDKFVWKGSDESRWCWAKGELIEMGVGGAVLVGEVKQVSPDLLPSLTGEENEDSLPLSPLIQEGE